MGAPVSIALSKLSLLVSMVGIWTCAGLALYWYELQPPPLTVSWIEAPYPYAVPGGTLRIEFVSTKTRDCDVRSEFTIVDGQRNVWNFDGVDGFGPVEGSYRLSYTVQVPEKAALGPAKFYERVTYDCGLGRIHVVQTPTVLFEIVEELP